MRMNSFFSFFFLFLLPAQTLTTNEFIRKPSDNVRIFESEVSDESFQFQQAKISANRSSAITMEESSSKEPKKYLRE